jgi:hypothetical protein
MLMKVIDTYIPYLKGVDALCSVEDISLVLDTHNRQHLHHAPWHNGDAQPQVSFSIAYSNEVIYLKYYVIEDVFKAEYNQFNDPVFEDSCVEFFIAFDNDPNYYNLEFNCMGTSRGQYGLHKSDRTFIPASLLKTIRHQTLLKSSSESNIQWELTLCIPKAIFSFHPGLSFAQSNARANFYKCGDGLPKPHFLCWSNIEAQKPEFHLSRFFKEIAFGPHAN